MASRERKLHIGISGSYGGMNLGDEAILQSILHQLRTSVDADITIFSKNPADTRARHAVERVIVASSMTRKEIAPIIKELDVFVLGGGGILYDRDAETYLREVSVAQEVGVPVFIYAVSAGPLRTTGSRRAVRAALNATSAPMIITVRDLLGLRLLEDVGVTHDIHLTADPALLLQAEPLDDDVLRAEGVDFDHQLVGFSVREPGPAAPDIDPEEYYALLANAADFIVDRYDAEVLFVPMEKTDVAHSHGVVSHMQNAERAEILRRKYSPGQILTLMSKLDFAVGMRLHFLIFAAIQGTPFAPLPYASKVSGLLTDLGLPTPPLGDIGIGELIARIDRSWDTRQDVRTKIDSAVPALQQRARRTHELLLGLAKQATSSSDEEADAARSAPH